MPDRQGLSCTCCKQVVCCVCDLSQSSPVTALAYSWLLQGAATQSLLASQRDLEVYDCYLKLEVCMHTSEGIVRI